jgi:hypothetical protein
MQVLYGLCISFSINGYIVKDAKEFRRGIALWSIFSFKWKRYI